MDLQTPIKNAGRFYSMQASKLEKLGVVTLRDLLFHIPSRYDDLSLISNIGSVQPGETVTIQGNVIDINNTYTRRGFTLQKALISDSTGSIEALWFNQPFIVKNMHAGDFVSIAGRVEAKGALGKTLVVKDYEVLPDKNSETTHTGRLVPVYPETRGLTSKWMRNKIKILLKDIQLLAELLPEDIRQRNGLLDIHTALRTIHFPKKENETLAARQRLAFEELFMLQLAGLLKRQEWHAQKTTHQFNVAKFKKETGALIKSLPFELTNSQQKALSDVFSDIQKPQVMNRLIQGDVGSGKTIVAAIAMYLAHLNGIQSVIMAPTEILANQHYKTICQILEPLGVKIKLVTGSTRKKNNDLGLKINEKNENHKSVIVNHQSNHPDILIGTHALLHQTEHFGNLGLVVIDEQQRFGVEQRALLRTMGNSPHFLTMTATPIPRTVFLTMYGDLEMSVLSDMPKGRKIVKTWLVPKFKRAAAYEWIKKQITTQHPSTIDYQPSTHNQVFIVCPFIEESETLTSVKAVKKEFEDLQKNVFKKEKMALLHGKMKSRDKDQILKDFRDHKYDILVATPVVEVGIDIPDATVMVIEAAERFGLSQLHQLRGRVGRSNKESFCLLFTEEESAMVKTRLKSLETTYSGAKLAEIDLQLRGAGDMYGTRQHGSDFLKIASFSDFPLIETTRKEAEYILGKINSFPLLRDYAKNAIIQRVSPD